MFLRPSIWLLIGLSLFGTPAWADQAALREALASLQQIGKAGQGHRPAMQAWQTLAAADAGDLTILLSGMRDDNPLANNWIRAAVDAVAERAQRQGEPLPLAALDAYLGDLQHSPRSRRVAFEWLTACDPAARDRWIPQLLNDPSLELRREAIAAQLTQAQQADEKGDRATAIAHYQQALNHGRDLDQIEAATAALRKLEQSVDLPRHFGFVMSWQLIGPFDNVATAGFDRVYPPEEQVDLTATYPGQYETVAWQMATTTDDYGKVDLNQLLGKHKGAAAYAVATFQSQVARPVELRLGCINANKIWLNGQLLTANHVYHSGDGIDQYVGRGELRAGENTILLKICQNEQTEDWAQDWTFQLRVCDALGTAVLSADR